MKLLHLDSSILGENSISRALTASIVAHLRVGNPGLNTSYRDLAADPLSHIDLTAMPGDAGDAAVTSQVVLDQFLDADIVVIGAPMYNFTLPSQLKAWLDRILIAGKTFRYGAHGPEGLAGGKRVILAVSRGNFYRAGAPSAGFEHLETYLRAVFGFIGIEPEVVVAEGVNAGPDHRGAAMTQADEAIAALAV